MHIPKIRAFENHLKKNDFKQIFKENNFFKSLKKVLNAVIPERSCNAYERVNYSKVGQDGV